eukprot:1161756-Pelagomonas_calceolata.AAC.5
MMPALYVFQTCTYTSASRAFCCCHPYTEHFDADDEAGADACASMLMRMMRLVLMLALYILQTCAYTSASRAFCCSPPFTEHVDDEEEEGADAGAVRVGGYPAAVVLQSLVRYPGASSSAGNDDDEEEEVVRLQCKVRVLIVPPFA